MYRHVFNNRFSKYLTPLVLAQTMINYLYELLFAAQPYEDFMINRHIGPN